MSTRMQEQTPASTPSGQRYDAILVLSFGGPEGMDDVIPFLENVLRGRNVPHNRLLEVAEHYYQFGGVSPINAQNRALIAALRQEFSATGIDLPIYFGNRNWHPLLEDTLQQMADDGVQRVLALFTSAYSSYSSCRQYREDIERAREVVGPSAPHVDKIRAFYNHPGFIEANVANAQAAFQQIPASRQAEAALVFTAHSLPVSMARKSAYEVQLKEACRLVAEGLGRDDWRLVFQSRSGPPHQPWLEPDVNDCLRELHQHSVQDVVIVPIGFISDHMEVIFDLDTEAQETAKALGIQLVRASTAGTHPVFIQMIRELVQERLTDNPTRRFLGLRGPGHDVCPLNCCLPA